MNRRFQNRHKTLVQLSYEVLVTCPSCKQCAKVTSLNTSPYLYYSKYRMVCSACGAAKEMDPKKRWDRQEDLFFGFPLYLQTSCCGQTLWAYNLEHLKYMEEYVCAELREPLPNSRSVENKLPKWIKSAKNREQILKSIKQLKQSII